MLSAVGLHLVEMLQQLITSMEKGQAEGGADSMNGSCFNGRLSKGTRDNIVSLLKVSG